MCARTKGRKLNGGTLAARALCGDTIVDDDTPYFFSWSARRIAARDSRSERRSKAGTRAGARRGCNHGANNGPESVLAGARRGGGRNRRSTKGKKKRGRRPRAQRGARWRGARGEKKNAMRCSAFFLWKNACALACRRSRRGVCTSELRDGGYNEKFKRKNKRRERTERAPLLPDSRARERGPARPKKREKKRCETPGSASSSLCRSCCCCCCCCCCCY
jgi:hypothetical protein